MVLLTGKKKMKIIQKLITIRMYLIGILIAFIGCESNKLNTPSLVSVRWVSEKPYCEVWLQNWGTYTRLLLIIDTDTVLIEPSQYSTEKKDKEYLSPKPYRLIKKQQMKGNIVWDDVINWENGNENEFIWKVDRANPKIKLPQVYNGTVAQYNDSLRLNISSNVENFVSLGLKPIYYK